MDTTWRVRPITGNDTQVVELLDAWIAAAPDPQDKLHCQALLHRITESGVPSHEINYGIFVDGGFVGGITTSSQHFNLMWIHWDHRRNGIGRRAARAVLSKQLKSYGVAIVNDPNEKMRGMLAKIAKESRRGPRDTYWPGDLQP